MTAREALVDSIEHWKRMIAWVQKQPPYAEVKRSLMEMNIFEGWVSTHCACCTFALKDADRYCPLKGTECTDYYCIGEWLNVNSAETWGEWLYRAEILVRKMQERHDDLYIKSLQSPESRH